eukprot:365952-Chlamydomonas_euryale.AAC.3
MHHPPSPRPGRSTGWGSGHHLAGPGSHLVPSCTIRPLQQASETGNATVTSVALFTRRQAMLSSSVLAGQTMTQLHAVHATCSHHARLHDGSGARPTGQFANHS